MKCFFQQGVCVPGLGTFTYSQKKLDVGNNKFIQIQRPVFILSEKFAMTHALNYTKHHTTGNCNEDLVVLCGKGKKLIHFKLSVLIHFGTDKVY